MFKRSIVAGVALMLVLSSRTFAQDEAVGIGISYERASTGTISVGGVAANSPAAKAGLVAGDYITAIDGIDTRDIADSDIPTRIRGPKGTTVKLTVLSAGQPPRVVPVLREMAPPRVG